MTRANTPDSLSTRTEIVALRIVLSDMASDQDETLIGHAGCLVLMLRTEDHLVMGSTARDHWEAILLGVHADIGDHRAVGRQHLADHIVHLLHPLRAQADGMECVCKL